MGISRFSLRFLALAGLLSLGNVAWASGPVLSQELDYYEIGDLDSPRATHTEPAMMLMGGGDWVPDAFHWWLEKAGNGHIVILRASGGDDMQQRLYEEIGGAASVQTLVFRDRAPADDPLHGCHRVGARFGRFCGVCRRQARLARAGAEHGA